MILIVDDHEDIRYVLARTLKIEGYEAVGVSSGFEALIYLADHTPALVVLDYHMPDMDGLMLLSEIKRNPRLREVRVIMFSADDGPAREKALRSGVDAYIVKGSLDWAELRGEILRLIGPGSAPAQLPPVAPQRAQDAG